jgi:hypothetical protein
VSRLESLLETRFYYDDLKDLKSTTNGDVALHLLHDFCSKAEYLSGDRVMGAIDNLFLYFLGFL